MISVQKPKKLIKKINYSPLPYQAIFHRSEKSKVYLSTGYGGGKTHSLVMKAFKLMAINYGLPGGIVAPTLKMFKRDVYPTIVAICNENNIPYKYNKQDSEFYFPHTKSTLYVFHGEDHGASIRGPNLAFMLFNEITLISKETFDAAIARVRLKLAPLRQIAMSGTPEDFNWVYEYFIENPRDDTELVFGDMRLNTHVAEDYAKTLMESYDELLVKRYVEGQFVNLNAGRAAYAFDRFKHSTDNLDRNDDVQTWVSLDFNVNPMAATLWNRKVIGSEKILEAFDEIVIPNSNTYEFCRVLKDRLGHNLDGVVIFPDPAGNARSTKSMGYSDIDILKEAGFTDIRFRAKIPSVRDCLNALNTLFSKNKIIINSKRCRNFIADLEQCVIKPGTNELDKTNPKRTHWLDGAKNMAEYEFPVRKPNWSREQQIR